MPLSLPTSTNASAPMLFRLEKFSFPQPKNAAAPTDAALCASTVVSSSQLKNALSPIAASAPEIVTPGMPSQSKKVSFLSSGTTPKWLQIKVFPFFRMTAAHTFTFIEKNSLSGLKNSVFMILLSP